MPGIDHSDVLVAFTARFLERARLSPAERAEVLRIARGFACKDSANEANLSPETIRGRRKQIYRKLDVAGAAELVSALLAFSLEMLAKGERMDAQPAPRQASSEASAPSVAPSALG